MSVGKYFLAAEEDATLAQGVLGNYRAFAAIEGCMPIEIFGTNIKAAAVIQRDIGTPIANISLFNRTLSGVDPA